MHFVKYTQNQSHTSILQQRTTVRQVVKVATVTNMDILKLIQIFTSNSGVQIVHRQTAFYPTEYSVTLINVAFLQVRSITGLEIISGQFNTSYSILMKCQCYDVIVSANKKSVKSCMEHTAPHKQFSVFLQFTILLYLYQFKQIPHANNVIMTLYKLTDKKLDNIKMSHDPVTVYKCHMILSVYKCHMILSQCVNVT